MGRNTGLWEPLGLPQEHNRQSMKKTVRVSHFFIGNFSLILRSLVVNLLCILCSRIRTYRELLMIFFHDKHWYRSEPLFAAEENSNEKDMEAEEEKEECNTFSKFENDRSQSPPPSQVTVTSAPTSSIPKKPEYEFLLFNYLLRFVHREGRIGDFARAGLLFLMDVAMSPGVPVTKLSD